jgi:hypothetical protein
VAPIPGLTDIAGLADILLSRLPELADECSSDPQLDAVCELEARTLRHLAGTTATSPSDLVLKVGVLIARLVADSAEVEIPDGEAALLRSLLRDLTVLTDVAARDAVRTRTVAGSDADRTDDGKRPPHWP